MLRSLKLAGLRVLERAGAFERAANSNWRRQRLVVLCYHGISLEDEHEWDPDLYMPAAQFARRMELIAQAGCQVLPFGEAVRRLYAHELPPRSVAITFDDGFHDFSARALPVLRQYGFPATVYLTTYYCCHPFPVFTVACRYVLWKCQGAVRQKDEGFELDLDLADAGSRSRTLRAILNYCEERRLSGAEKNALLEHIASRLDFDYRRFISSRMLQLLTPGETAKLAREGVDFQLHTHRHRTPLDPEQFRNEIEENRTRLESLTGAGAEHFCFPGGVVHPPFAGWLRELGVTTATTCTAGLCERASEPLLLPRYVDTSGATELEFESWTSGVQAFLPSRRMLGNWHARSAGGSQQVNRLPDLELRY
jgi:peptidoglycan/xylan/chitin deacetylase (PgdA/CDA1 family)